MIKNIFILSIAVMLVGKAFAQNKPPTKKELRQKHIKQLIQKEEEGQLIFNKQFVFGVQLNSDGYGLSFQLARFKTPYLSNFYELSLGEHKSDKEERVLNLSIPGGNFFKYGKINNFFYAKLGFGQQRLIGGKGNKNGVAVSLLYSGGFSAGLLKPYVLEARDSITGVSQFISYDKNNPDARYVDKPYLIIGPGGFFKGWNQLKFRPGVYGKVGMRFDYGRYRETISALEVGINAEYYQYGMPIMANIRGEQFFFNVYAALQFGVRK